MKDIVDKKKVPLYLWVGLGYFLLGLVFTAHSYPSRFFVLVPNHIWAVVYVIVINYILFEHTIPFVFRKRKTVIRNILLAILLFFVHLMLYCCGAYGWRLLGMQLGVYTELNPSSSTDHDLSDTMAYSVGSIVLFGISRHIYHYIHLKQAEQRLRIEKQEAELNYLRSQTNPHFLFNTLNNIYSLARDKSDQAPASILQLSKILRFMLYEAGGQYIPIERELKIISDYIELEKLRYDESLRINFSYDVEDMKQAIPPLLLIPLVENAFKHGASETRVRPFVDIHLSVNNRQLVLTVQNSTEPSTTERRIVENIGLSNLRRQLELLYSDYDLSIQQADAAFTAILKINLASHV